MKKLIRPIIVTCVLGLSSYLVYGIITRMQHKNAVEITLQTIPDFSFKTLENKTYTNAHLKPNVPIILVYFNSECDFCQHEAKSISENLDTFKNVQILFVSSEPIKAIKLFSEQHHLNKQPNLTFLHDNTDTFSNQFDAKSIPYILIYDKNKQLIKRHNGQLSATAILNVLYD